jgi:hypothetical protein
MLILICNDQGQGQNAERLKTHIVFKVTQDHKVGSNIWSDDKFPDKYNLTQRYVETTSSFVPSPMGGTNDGCRFG